MGDEEIAHGTCTADVKETTLVMQVFEKILGVGGIGLAGQPVGLDVGDGNDRKFKPFGRVQSHDLDAAFLEAHLLAGGKAGR